MARGRLGKAPSRFGDTAPVAQRLTSAAGDRFAQREAIEPWRRWYKSARWQSLRWHVLVRDQFRCQMCGEIETDTARLVADHRIAHRGNPALFWGEGNLWCLCAACHSGAKQAEEAATR